MDHICDAAIVGTNENDGVIALLDEKKDVIVLAAPFLQPPAACGTISPIVSVAFGGAFGKGKSFTFSLIMKRCS